MVVALPSVMVKVVFLLEVAAEWWLIAERTVALCGRSEVLLHGTGTDVDVRHDAFQRESLLTEHCIICTRHQTT